jgi:hypothetical protein
MARWLTLFLLPVLVLGLASCGGGDDDDDSGDDSGDDAATPEDSGDDGDNGVTDSSDATGSLTIDGEEYTLDMQTCELSVGASNLTAIAGTLDGESDADFSASGIENAVAIAVRFGNGGYIAAGVEMDRDGSTVSWEGELYDPTNPAKQVEAEFSVEC